MLGMFDCSSVQPRKYLRKRETSCREDEIAGLPTEEERRREVTILQIWDRSY